MEDAARSVRGAIEPVAERRALTLPLWWVSLRERSPWRRSRVLNRALGATASAVFAAALVTGAGFRMLHLTSYGGGINSDEAVVYLMGGHAHHWRFQDFS